MANSKISNLPAAITSSGADILPVVQSNVTKKVAVQDLQPQLLKSTATTGLMSIVGPGAGTTRVMTIPNANFTVARTDAAQSFTGDQTFSTGNLVIGTATKGIDFASSGGGVFNYYEEYTAPSTACTNALTVAVIWKATKKGNSVTLTLPPTQGVASAATYFAYGSLLPVRFRPAASLGFLCQIKDNDANVATAGLIMVLSTGEIRVYRDATAATNFTAGVNAGLGQSLGTAVSWTI